MSKRIRYLAALTWGLVAVGPAAAAPAAANMDWASYFSPGSYTDWHSKLLVGSIVLLVVAALAKLVETSRTMRTAGPVMTPLDRMGEMPIEPPESIGLADRNAREIARAVEHQRIRPDAVHSPELSAAG